MAQSPRDYFLRNLSTWEYDIPYATQWAITLIPEDATLDGFIESLQYYTTVDYANDFYINSNVIDALMSDDVQGVQDGVGLFFAQGISIPKEGFRPTVIGIDHSGGFLKGAIGGDRMGVGDKILTTDLLETNLDFIDGIIRPWIIAASYQGLIATSSLPSLKCTMLVTQFTKGIKRPIRKVHKFVGCVPFDVAGSTLDYDTERLVKRQVSWTFNHHTYDILEGEPVSLVDTFARSFNRAFESAIVNAFRGR